MGGYSVRTREGAEGLAGRGLRQEGAGVLGD